MRRPTSLRVRVALAAGAAIALATALLGATAVIPVSYTHLTLPTKRIV